MSGTKVDQTMAGALGEGGFSEKDVAALVWDLSSPPR